MAKVPNQNNITEIIEEVKKQMEAIEKSAENLPNGESMKKMTQCYSGLLDVIGEIVKINNIAKNAKIDSKKIKSFFGDVSDVIKQLAEDAKKIESEAAKSEQTLENLNKKLNKITPKFKEFNDNVKNLIGIITGEEIKINFFKVTGKWLAIIWAVTLMAVTLIYVSTILAMMIPAVPLLAMARYMLGRIDEFLIRLEFVFDTINSIKVNPITWLKILYISGLVLLLGLMMSAIGFILSLGLVLVPLFEGSRLTMIIWERVLMQMSDIFNVIDEMKVKPTTFIKIWLIRRNTKRLGHLINTIGWMALGSIMVMAMMGFAPGIKLIFYSINTLLACLYQTFKILLKIPSGIRVAFKIKSIGSAVTRLYRFLRKTMWQTHRFVKSTLIYGGILRMVIKLYEVKFLVKAIRDIMLALSALALPAVLITVLYPMIYIGVKLMFNILKLIRKSARRARLGSVERTMIKLMVVIGTITMCALMFVIMALVFKQAMIGMVLAVVFVVALVMFMFLLRLFVKVLLKCQPLKIMLAFLLVALIMFELVVVGVCLLLVAMIGALLIENIPGIIIFLLGLMIIMVVLALMGMVLEYILPFIEIAAACILIVVVSFALIVGAILAIAVMLWMLSKINLDEDAIMANVDKVLNTVWGIIERLFNRSTKKKEESIWDKILKPFKFIFGTYGDIIILLAGIVVLVLAVLAVGCILLIAGILRLLQMLDLDEAKILENVEHVFTIVDHIIGTIFADRTDKSKRSDRGILITIVSWIEPSLGKILEAALALVYLALALISIGLVLAIAGLLRLLQEINLDAEKIMENVRTVFDTADLIIERIMSPRNEDGEGSSRGILVTIVSWVDEGLAKIVEAALSIVYLFLIMISIIIVLAIAGLLRLLQEIDLDVDKVIENVEAVFTAANLIHKRVFESDVNDPPGSSMGLLGIIVGFFNPGLAKIIDALMSILYIGLIFVAISIICGIANLLAEIQALEIDKDTLTTRINTIFEICKLVIDKVFGDNGLELPESKEGGLFGSLISFFAPGLGKILNALMKIATLGLVFAALSSLKGIAQCLKEIQDIEVDANAAKEKVTWLIGISGEIAEKIFGTEAKIKFPVPPEERKSVFGALIDWAFGGESDEDRAIKAAMKRVETLGVIAAAVGALGTIQDNIKKMMDVDFSDFDGATTKIDSIMKLAADISEIIFGDKYKITLPEPTKDEVEAALIDMGLTHWWRSSNAAEKAAAANEAKMRKAMQTVQSLGMIASAVGSLGTIVSSMNSIMEFEKPKTNDLKAKVQAVMQAASEVAFIIFNDDNIGMKGGNAAGIKGQTADMLAKINFVKSGVDGLKDVADSWAALDKALQQEITGKDKVSNSCRSVLNLVEEITNRSIDKDEFHHKVDLINRLSAAMKQMTSFSPNDVKNAEKLINTYITYLSKIDSMNLKKLDLATGMMQAFAKVAESIKGDFNGLAKAVNQDIAPMLEKLDKSMQEVKAVYEEMVKEMSKPIDINVNNGNPGGITPPAADVPGDEGQQSGVSVTPGNPTNPNPGGKVDATPAVNPVATQAQNAQRTKKASAVMNNDDAISKGKKYKLIVSVEKAEKIS